MKEISIPNFRIFSLILSAFLTGVFISSFFQNDFSPIYPFAIIIILLQLSLYFIFSRKYLHLLIIICSFCFVAGWLSFSLANSKLNSISLPFDQDTSLIGVVSNYPDASGNSQNFYLQTTEFVENAKIYTQTSRYPEYFYGDILKIDGKLEKPTNFSDFDWISYLKRFGATATIKNPKIELAENGKGNKLILALYKIRQSFLRAVDKSLPEPESSLASGLLIGSKEGFSDSLLADFSKVGITHIIALSGYNVTIIIIFLTDLMLGYISRKKIFIISTLLIVGFVAMTGAAPSVIRAAIISLLIAFGKTIGRKADMTNLILLSAAIMVAINPFILRFDIGFQLSFLAFIGLVYFSPILKQLFDRKKLKKIPSQIRSAITETLSAQIFVIPLILSTFGLVSIISPVTNILILPFIPAIMFFIFFSTIVYWIFPAAGHLAFLITYQPLKYIITITRLFAGFRFSSITIGKNWQNAIMICYSLFIALIIYRNRKVYAKEIN